MIGTPFDCSAYETVCTRDFTGREWIFRKIDEGVGDPVDLSFLGTHAGEAI